jgi:uncharacterized membrane protein
MRSEEVNGLLNANGQPKFPLAKLAIATVARNLCKRGSIRSFQEDSPMNTSQKSQEEYTQIANALGWFSLSLGLAEIVAPGAVARLAGVQTDEGQRALLRSPSFGLREAATGVGLLTQHDKSSWLWTRVIGDAIDIGTLLSALGRPRNNRKRVAAALAAVLGVTAIDVVCARKLSSVPAKVVMPRVARSVWINTTAQEAYSFWRRFENLPLFMRHLESVETLDDNVSRWRATGPLGQSYEWLARLERDEPNRQIAWKSVEGSEIENSGTVSFEERSGRRGVIVHVAISYDIPFGHAGEVVAKLLGKDPEGMVADDMRAFKQTLETGEILYSDASIHPVIHPAQPSGTRAA